MMTTNVRIVSDGLAGGTRLLDEATGQDVFPGCVTALNWHVDAGDVARVEATLIAIPVDVRGELRTATPARLEDLYHRIGATLDEDDAQLLLHAAALLRAAAAPAAG